MNIPFLPGFFTKLQIYDELKGFNELSEKKELWNVQKAVLAWSTGEGHQHIGSALSTEHVARAVSTAIEDHKLNREDEEKYRNVRQQVLTGLSTLGYGENQTNGTVLINRQGLLAGQVLCETAWLNNNGKYEIWRLLFYIVLFFGLIALITGSTASILDIVDSPFELRFTTYIFALLLTVTSNFLIIYTKRNAWDVVFLNTSITIFLLFAVGLIVDTEIQWLHIVWAIVAVYRKTTKNNA